MSDNLRLCVAAIHSLGPRPLYEMLLEILQGADVADTILRYANLNQFENFIRDNGGSEL